MLLSVNIDCVFFSFILLYPSCHFFLFGTSWNLTHPEFLAQFKTEKKLNSTGALMLSSSSQKVKQHEEKLAQVRSVGESAFTPTAAEAAAFAHFCVGTTSGHCF